MADILHFIDKNPEDGTVYDMLINLDHVRRAIHFVDKDGIHHASIMSFDPHNGSEVVNFIGDGALSFWIAWTQYETATVVFEDPPVPPPHTGGRGVLAN